MIVLSGPSVPSGSGSCQCTRMSPQLSLRWLFNAGPTTEGRQLPPFTSLSCWHLFCLLCALHTLDPWVLLKKAILPGGRCQEPLGGKILTEQGDFPLLGCRKAIFLTLMKMGAAFSVLHSGRNAGHTTGRCGSSECATSALNGFPTSSLAARTEDVHVGPSLPWMMRV